ncbi:MAG: RagB/SusD family nutrient uptake outer membrane protein [Bacteroidetes bacterium]|nr:RagB/SusD family nutrient uptake outer membrane protein [Fibrella sp.]
MFKKVLIGGTCLCITLLGLWSCKDSFLEFTPTDRISDAAYWKTASDFQAGVNAAYFALQWDASADSWQALAGMPAGDVKPTEDANYFTLESLQYASNNGQVNAAWNSCWTIITRANLVLTRIEPVSIPDADKKKIIGEAKFLRGFAYFLLARNFGDVPLITAEQTAASPTDVPRTPVAQVYDQIVKDLTEAAASLPTKWDNANVGRATRGSALGYLAYTHMYQKQWPNAAKATEDLVALGTYNLVKDYRKVFDLANENNEESVFEVQYRDSQLGWGPSRNGHYFPQKQAPRGIGDDYSPYGGWGVQIPTKQLVNAFEKGDTRRAACILAPGEKYYGFTMDSLKTPTGYAFTKYWVGPSKNDHSPLNLPQLRFAEVLLHYAEILNETGKIVEAYAQLNRVRARAGLAPKPVGDKVKCMEDIAQEWRVETFAEFNFWYELTRTGRAAAFVQKEYGRTLAPFRTLFPIPQSELDLNKALNQNPGY